MTDGVALPLRYLPAPSQPAVVRPYVAVGQVWCGDGWWPFTADALALYGQWGQFGDQVLCGPVTP